MVKRKTLKKIIKLKSRDENFKEKNTGQNRLREKHWTKKVKRKTPDKNGKKKNTGQKW